MSFNQNRITLLDIYGIANHSDIYRLTSYISSISNALAVCNNAAKERIALVIPVNRYRRYLPQRITEFDCYRVPCLRAP